MLAAWLAMHRNMLKRYQHISMWVRILVYNVRHGWIKGILSKVFGNGLNRQVQKGKRLIISVAREMTYKRQK